VTFPVMGKCDVNGEKESELYRWLKQKAVGRNPKVPSWSPLEQSGLDSKDIQWNFEKFLVWRVDGTPRISRFAYDVSPAHIAKYVRRAFRRLDYTPSRKKMEL